MVQRRHRPRILAIGPSTEIAETRGDSLDERQAHAFDDELSQLSLRRQFGRQQQAVCGDVALEDTRHVGRSQRQGPGAKIGRASCRERVCQYVWISVVAVSLKKK